MNGKFKNNLNNAQLSQASYAVLSKGSDSKEDDYRAALTYRNNFSNSQAIQFINQYKIIEDQPNINKGFSATLFQDTEEVEEYTLAIRGTEIELSLVLIDDLVLTNLADVVDDGITLNRAIGLFNFYQKLITPKNEDAIQLDLYEGPFAPDPVVTHQIINTQHEDSLSVFHHFKEKELFHGKYRRECSRMIEAESL